MQFERAIFFGKIALVLTIINFLIMGFLIVDVFQQFSSCFINYLLLALVGTILSALITAIVSVRLYKTQLAVILVFINAFLMITPLILLYIIIKGFCVIC